MEPALAQSGAYERSSAAPRQNLLTFLEQGIEHNASGEGYPLYVEKELRAYIGCGDPALGFARIRCPACGFERLLPFSCKNRGICPSCTGRRMSEEAAYLVDMVLPKSRYRQWTFTFPWPVRRLMARDYTLITAILGIVIRALYAYQRPMARRAGHRGAKCASVTFVQRFGGAVNANVHLHVLLPDAVFLPGETEDDEFRLVPLAPPEDKDVQAILEKVVRRVSSLVHKRCGIEDELGLEPETDVLDGAIEEAMRKVPKLPSCSDDELDDETSADAPVPSRTAKRSFRLQGHHLAVQQGDVQQVLTDHRPVAEVVVSLDVQPPTEPLFGGDRSHAQIAQVDVRVAKLEPRQSDQVRRQRQPRECLPSSAWRRRHRSWGRKKTALFEP